MDRKIGERQRWAWLSGGLSAVIAACACGIGWLWVLLGGLGITAYYIYMDARLPAAGLARLLSRPLAALTLLWTVLAMAWAANLADRAFPMVDGFPLLGWIMLAMAAWGSRKGVAACAGCAGVLCLFLLFLYGMVAVFAVPDVRWENLRNTGGPDSILWVTTLFLLPASVWYAPCAKGRGRPVWIMLLLPVSAAALAAITAGVLSPTLASAHPAALYTLTQSVSLFGVVERIEPLLSAAMIMGVFCLLSAMACACGALGDRIRPWKHTGTAACLLSAALMYPMGRADSLILTIGSGFFWLILPVAALRMGKRST